MNSRQRRISYDLTELAEDFADPADNTQALTHGYLIGFIGDYAQQN